MPDIHDLLDDIVKSTMEAQADAISQMVLGFFGGDVFALADALGEHAADFQLEGVPLPNGRVQVTFRSLIDNTQAQIILAPTPVTTP